ncbi:hypothetical protein L3K78_15695 [Oscillospiraceae bacterium SCCA1]|nr:hypothetical protein [Oscillospiraceae bacterium SCCA1]
MRAPTAGEKAANGHSCGSVTYKKMTQHTTNQGQNKIIIKKIKKKKKILKKNLRGRPGDFV